MIFAFTDCHINVIIPYTVAGIGSPVMRVHRCHSLVCHKTGVELMPLAGSTEHILRCGRAWYQDKSAFTGLWVAVRGQKQSWCATVMGFTCTI